MDKFEVKTKDYNTYSNLDDKPTELDIMNEFYLGEFPRCVNYITKYVECAKLKQRKPEVICTSKFQQMNWCVIGQLCPNEFKALSECAVEKGKNQYEIENIPFTCKLRFRSLDKCLTSQTKEVEKQMERNPKWKKIAED